MKSASYDSLTHLRDRVTFFADKNTVTDTVSLVHLIMPQIIHMFPKSDISDNGLMDRLNYAASKAVYPAKSENDILFFGEELEEALSRKMYILNEVKYAIEENGLIDGISWIVLEKVCDFLGRHKDLPLKTISINMTGQQVLDPTFISRIEENLAKNNIEGNKLRIEITERTVTDDFDEVKKIMQNLSEKGIHFYLDDFGTGYSNLSSMLKLPFEVIKFDVSLMRLMEESGKGLKTIELLINIMHENSYLIVSEGIETAKQAEQAFKLRMDRIQGFYYSKPMAEAQLIEFLENFDKSSKTS